MKNKTLLPIFLFLLFTFATAWADNVDLSKVTKNKTLQDGDVVTGELGANVKISIAAGATVTLNGVTINGVESDYDGLKWAGITCLGNCEIILADKTENRVRGFYSDFPGIYVPEGYTLTISGTGSLDARGNNGAGIGAGNDLSCGNIVISGGLITATGGQGAAGIGGNFAGSVGGITISGGVVTAKGGQDAAGIGGGGGSVGNITISGGVVAATGGQNAAGIGGGDAESAGDITISGGAVTAKGGENAAGIGSGYAGSVGKIEISGFKTRVTVERGEGNAPYSIGSGYEGSRNGSISVGRVEYSDDIETTPFVYPNVNKQLDLRYSTDNTNAIATAVVSGNLYNVTLLDRTIYADGRWNSLTLPFSLTEWEIAVSPLSGSTIKELDVAKSRLDGDKLTLNFKEVTAIEAGKPYIVKANVDLLIHNKAEWESFAERVNNGETFEGKVVKLANDFDNSGAPVTKMVGSYSWNSTTKVAESKPFKGTFDGNGRTLTVGISSNEQYTAPFRSVNGATVRNLTLAGNIQVSQKLVGGMFAFAAGENVISNCRISATITSTVNGDGTVGGFVSNIQGGHTRIENSLFDGRFEGSNTYRWSGFVGWVETSVLDSHTGMTAYLSISNSLFSPTTIGVNLSEGNKTFYRGRSGYTSTLTKCYYTKDLGTEQGTDASSMNVNSLVSDLGSSNWKVVSGKAVPKMTTNILNPTFSYVTLDATVSTVTTSNDGHVMLNGTYGPFDATEGLLFDAHNTVNGAFHAALSASRDGYTFSGWYTDDKKKTPATSIPFDIDGSATLYTKWKKLLTNPEISIADISDTTYTGLEIEPEVAVYDGKTPLKLGTDYTVSYSDNINAGSATVTITGNGDYGGTVEKTFTITRAPLTITALNDTIVYGDEPSNAGVKFDGFVNEENEKSLNGTLVYSNEYKQYGNVGDYAISPSGLTAGNYEITFVDGKLTVEPKYVAVTWDKQNTFTYDGFEHAPTATLEGVLENDKCGFTVAGAAVNVGKYTASVTELDNENYKLPETVANQDFEITKAPLTITAKNETMVYGDEPSNAGVEFSGFIGEDNEKSLNGALVYSYNYKQYGNVGEYSITPSGLTSDNYEITFVDGKLTVEPKELTIIWGEQTSFVYDGEDHNPTAKLGGIVNNDRIPWHLTGFQTNVGKHTAIVTEIGNSNYKLPKTGCEKEYEITKAPLKISAMNNTIVYGDKPVDGGIMYGEFAGMESSNVLKGMLTFEFSYKQYGDVGEYAITPSGLTADNYEIEFVAGKLTVEPKVVSVAWGKQTSFTYNGTVQAPAATAEGLVEGDECSVVVSGATDVGKYTATATKLSNTNYKLPATGLEQAFEITKANPTLVKAPVAVENLVYNGKAQTLVTAGEAENGVMVYKLEGSDKYSETLPTATEAGDYTVYFMVQGNENYNDLKAQSLKASIAAPASSSSVEESSSSVEIASNSSSSRNDNVSSSSRKDVSSSSSRKGKSSSSSSKEKKEGFTPVVASGLNVQFVRNELAVTASTASEVKVNVFDLQGNLKKQYHGHSAGTHNVSLNQMGRGTYLVRVVSGSSERTLRVQVK